MRSRWLTNFLLALIAFGILAYLSWTVYRDQQTSKAARLAREEHQRIEMAQERITIWDNAANRDMVDQLEDWLKRQTGKREITLDHVYTRSFRIDDVKWSGGRDATVTGILTVQGGDEKNPAFYVSWIRPMHLNDRGSWESDTTTFQLIPDPPEAKSNHWRIKMLLSPRAFRDAGIP